MSEGSIPIAILQHAAELEVSLDVAGQLKRLRVVPSPPRNTTSVKGGT